APPPAPLPPPVTARRPDSAALAARKDSGKAPVKKPADSTAKAPVLAKARDTVKKAGDDKKDDDKKPEPKQEPKTEAPKKTDVAKDAAKTDAPKTEAPKKKDDATDAPNSSLDEFMYKAARVSQQEGALNEAIARYKNLTNSASPKYVELAKYQIAQCYKAQGHHGKAKRMFREVIKMNGSMKAQAQQAIDNDQSDAD
ncbi:MAG TPA: hypothetical protein VGC22_11750, partial [Chitinophaga sp.]